MRCSRKHRVKRLTPQQRKRNSQLYRCRYCGDVIHERQAEQILQIDKTCACISCLELLSFDYEHSLSEGVLHG